MIAVTRLDGREVLINADLIECIEQTPDTIISFSSGHKLIVRDLPGEVAARVIAYRRTLFSDGPETPVPPETPSGESA